MGGVLSSINHIPGGLKGLHVYDWPSYEYDRTHLTDEEQHEVDIMEDNELRYYAIPMAWMEFIFQQATWDHP